MYKLGYAFFPIYRQGYISKFKTNEIRTCRESVVRSISLNNTITKMKSVIYFTWNKALFLYSFPDFVNFISLYY